MVLHGQLKNAKQGMDLRLALHTVDAARLAKLIVLDVSRNANPIPTRFTADSHLIRTRFTPRFTHNSQPIPSRFKPESHLIHTRLPAGPHPIQTRFKTNSV